MSRPGHYGNFYDPVGSQTNQPSGYTYQTNATPATAYSTTSGSQGYGSGYPAFNNSAYATQQYGGPQQPGHSERHSANLGSDSGAKGYSAQADRAAADSRYQDESWSASSYNPGTFRPGGAQADPYQTSSAAPSYTPQPAALNVPGRSTPIDRGQSSGSSVRPASRPHEPVSSSAASGGYSQTAYALPVPQRYQSPLHAAQASRSHGRQPSQGAGSQPAGHMETAQSTQQRSHQSETSASTHSMTTVNPSHVYDNRAELQRQAQIEAERRRKREAEEAAKRAEEELVAAIDRERVAAEEARAEQQRLDKQRADAAEAKAKAKEEAKEKRKRARDEKRRSSTAASALQQLASGGAEDNGTTRAAAQGLDEESEMRAMFQKMREFNSRNPAMLAKLWEEERKTHAASQSPQPGASGSRAQVDPSGDASHPQSHAAMDGRAKSVKPSTERTTSMDMPPANSSAATRTPAAPATQPPPPASSASASSANHWPGYSKNQIAGTAAAWLMSLPQNKGKVIDKAIIWNILTQNPSYVQLCELLEQRGLSFDRTALARELVRANPDGSKSSSALQNDTGAAARNGSRTSAAQRATIEAQAAILSTNSTDQHARPGTVTYEAPMPGSVSAPNGLPAWYGKDGEHGNHQQSRGSEGRASKAAPSWSSDVKPEVKATPARRPPADKEEAARKTFGDLVDLTAEDSDNENLPLPSINPAAPHDPTQSYSAYAPQDSRQPMAYNQFMRGTPSGTTMTANGHLHRPGPPNGAGGSGIVDGGADLQQERPKPVPQPKGPTAEQLQTLRMRGKMLVEPIMRDRVARKSHYDSRTIARDVLLATGRHPDMRSLNAHLASMQKLLGDHGGQVDHEGRNNLKCDLATIKWDIIDPGEPTDAKPNGKHAREDDADDEAELDLFPTIEGPEEHVAAATVPKEKKRRKRHVKNTDPLTQHQPAKSPSTRSPRPKQAHGNTTPAAASASDMSGAVGYAAFAQVGADGKKKKGRPFGWKKSVHSREAQGLPPAGPYVPKRASTSQTPNKSAQVAPEYQVYKCRWRDCPAKLHNLSVLQKHVFQIHGKANADGDITCHWEGCDAARFARPNLWTTHVQKRHLEPIAWKLGDGPRGGSHSDSVHDSDAYLSDTRGRSVTPVILPSLPKSSADDGQTQVAANTIRWSKKRSRKTTDAEEGPTPEEQLQELERHKKAVGSVLDRHGCVLASEERRGTFLDDEDFEDEVYGSEHDVADD